MKKCDHVGIDPSSVNWFSQKGAAFCTFAFPDYFSHLWTGANDLALNHNVCSCARMLACVCARVCVPARACVCGCVRACMGACLHVCSVSVYVCVCPSVPCGGAIGAHGVPEGSLRWKGQGGPQGAREDPRGAQENLSHSWNRQTIGGDI